MTDEPRVESIHLAPRPMEVTRAWPADRPLMMLHSGRRHQRWSRWSILAEPTRFISSQNDPLGTLASVTGQELDPALHPDLPFLGGWIGYFSYDLGRVIEPAAMHPGGAHDDRGWPHFELAWCPNALLYDHHAQRWWAVGDVDDLLKALVRSPHGPDRKSDRPEIGEVTSTLSRERYVDLVARTIELIRAGDIYQANITQRLSCSFSGSTRALWRCAARAGRSWFGAYLECPSGCIVSQSPELFLSVNAATREVITRPIKGTLAASRAPFELARSEKDAAELHMIVDLMRNDLGRVCAFGSVRVRRGRAIEKHLAVHHGVGEIAGKLRDDASFTDLLRASFPPGSVTGAPKIRAMQIIDELEPVRRGPYCGSIGFIDRRGAAMLNVAIRTMVLRDSSLLDRNWIAEDATLDYGAGGGIVTDSNPEDEYEESMQKAEVFRRTLAALRGEKTLGAVV